MDKIYLLIGNDTPLAVCLRKSEGEETPVPYDLSEARHLRLTLVGHGMRVCAKDIEVSGDDNNVVSGMIPGRSLLKGDYDLEVTFTLDGRDKRFAINDMFEAVDFLAEDADGEAEGEGAGIHVTVTVQPELIEIAGPTGPQGKSAYQVWLDDGHTGTEDDFFEWLAAQTPNPDWEQNDPSKADYIKGRTHYEETYTIRIDNALLAWSGSTSQNLDFWFHGTNVHIPRTSTGWGLTWQGGELFIDDNGSGYELGVYNGEGWSINPFDPSYDQQPYPLNVDVVIASGTTVHKLDNKFLDMDLTPTAQSDKPVMSGGVASAISSFITRSVNDLANYYLKSETYTKAEVESLIGAIQHFHYEIYPNLESVTHLANNILYLIGPTGSGTDKYEEYVYDSTKTNPWVKIGDTSIDLSGYVTTEALNTALANYVTSTALATALSAKQNTLVSGENIKTVNGQSILGSGNISIEGASDAVKYTSQSLTDAQKGQARTNIGAASDSEVSQLRSEVFGGEIEKEVVWSAGYINNYGLISSSSLSKFSQPILLRAGEAVTVGTKNPNITIIGSTNANSLAIGDTVDIIQKIPPQFDQFETYSYTATADIKIVLCVLAANYTLEFSTVNCLEHDVEELKENTLRLGQGMEDLAVVDDSDNAIALFKNGSIKTKGFDSSYIEDTIRYGYISAEQYNQIPIEKCGYEKLCRFPTCEILGGKVSMAYEQFNYITRLALFGDLHVGYGYSFADSGDVWKDWENYVGLSLERASKKVPDFGIALGDILSSINEYVYNLGGKGIEERNDWYNRMRQFGYPLFNIFGNHDNALPDFTHTGVIEIENIRFIVFHMDIVYTSPFSTYNINDDEYVWLENAIKDSYNNGFITVLVSHYPIIGIVAEGQSAPENYFGHLLVNNHGQDLINLCKTYNVRLHIHGHAHPTGLPYRIMNDNGVPFDMTEVEIGLGARAYVILEIKKDGFHFTEYPLTASTGAVEEDGVTIRTFEVLDDAPGRTLFIPFYNQQAGTIRSNDWTPYPGLEQ